MGDPTEWLDVGEACEYLRVSKTTLYSYIKDGRLPFYHLAGGQRRIKKSDIDALLVPGKPEDIQEECDDTADGG